MSRVLLKCPLTRSRFIRRRSAEEQRQLRQLRHACSVCYFMRLDRAHRANSIPVSLSFPFSLFLFSQNVRAHGARPSESPGHRLKNVIDCSPPPPAWCSMFYRCFALAIPDIRLKPYVSPARKRASTTSYAASYHFVLSSYSHGAPSPWNDHLKLCQNGKYTVRKILHSTFHEDRRP